MCAKDVKVAIILYLEDALKMIQSVVLTRKMSVLVAFLDISLLRESV